MYNSSNILSYARVYYIPKGSRSKKRKIGNPKGRYYLGDREYYQNVYLKSEHWKVLRREKLKLNHVCEKCGAKRYVEPHHLKYRNLYDVTVCDLLSLCRKCHREEHKVIINRKKKKVKKRPKTNFTIGKLMLDWLCKK